MPRRNRGHSVKSWFFLCLFSLASELLQQSRRTKRTIIQRIITTISFLIVLSRYNIKVNVFTRRSYCNLDFKPHTVPLAVILIMSLIARNLLSINGISVRSSCKYFGHSSSSTLPVKAGIELKNLNIFKGQDAPVTLDRSEYPSWVENLPQPLPSLAVLRKVPNEEANLEQIKRYLRLTRRLEVRKNNEESSS